MPLPPSRCCRHFIQSVLFVQCPACKPGVSHLPISDLVPFTQVRYHSLFHMVSHMGQCFAAISIMKVADPAFHGRVDLIHYPVKRHNRPLSFRKMSDAVFDRCQGFLRWLNMGVIVPRLPASSHPDRKPKKVKLPFIGVDGF